MKWELLHNTMQYIFIITFKISFTYPLGHLYKLKHLLGYLLNLKRLFFVPLDSGGINLLPSSRRAFSSSFGIEASSARKCDKFNLCLMACDNKADLESCFIAMRKSNQVHVTLWYSRVGTTNLKLDTSSKFFSFFALIAHTHWQFRNLDVNKQFVLFCTLLHNFNIILILQRHIEARFLVGFPKRCLLLAASSILICCNVPTRKFFFCSIIGETELHHCLEELVR